MNTQQIAERLVALCREGQYEQVYDELFADDAENIEMPAMANGPLGNAKGLDAIRAKGKAWGEAVEQVHGGSVGEPSVSGNWFSVPMSLDVTMKGQGRMQMEEMCLYQVRDGKIVREQFFYDA
ncbi:MAG TPA: nuclear transport factor 2 family protein [Pseudoxanthomonas sp.]|uniref:Nuclear transport factor 2 family protein n=1 Tax=Pseudoxanthomonas helianthi TaxID=1453541 RepID=A0A940WZE5_9GAMM|nr:nuclear transport factor 2 family protein [Pseudoxanthomonas helianthi]MBP3983663.1 nuclear transport factor 2 family protein [Pseudoxanthomonas helianthi]HWU69941.1 nuclear transport factor 2 family protein [Pseudoxanthomonas sp.]